MPETRNTVVVTGGGTGGHVFPALAIADELVRRKFHVIYVGSATGMEARLVPEKGLEFHTVRSIQVKNKNPMRVLLGLATLARSIFWSVGFLRRQRPVAVIGVGGYISVPISIAAFLTRVPLYLQEQNASVGIANRFLGRLSRVIFLGFEAAKKSFPERRCIVTGNPIRREFLGVPPPQDGPGELFIFGGSQGAKAINSAIVSFLPRLRARFPDLRITHQTGEADHARIVAAYRELGIEAEIVPFIRDMLSCYRRASLVVCRSGALTVSELMATRRPAVLVPYPRRGQNDQTANAYMLRDRGVAEVIEQGEAFESRLERAVLGALEPARLAAARKAYSELHVSDALATIGDHLEKDLHLRVAG